MSRLDDVPGGSGRDDNEVGYAMMPQCSGHVHSRFVAHEKSDANTDHSEPQPSDPELRHHGGTRRSGDEEKTTRPNPAESRIYKPLTQVNPFTGVAYPMQIRGHPNRSRPLHPNGLFSPRNPPQVSGAGCAQGYAEKPGARCLAVVSRTTPILCRSPSICGSQMIGFNRHTRRSRGWGSGSL